MKPDLTLIQTEVAALLLQGLYVEVPSIDEELIETGLLDSLKIVELLVGLEQRFAIRIPLQDLELASFRTVASIAALVARLQAAGEMPGAVNSATPGHRASLSLPN